VVEFTPQSGQTGAGTTPATSAHKRVAIVGYSDALLVVIAG
jgi:hypothetical protein